MLQRPPNAKQTPIANFGSAWIRPLTQTRLLTEPTLLRFRSSEEQRLEDTSRDREVTISGLGSSRGPDASGLAAGMTVIAGILVGGAVGLGVGYLLGRLAIGLMVGATIGIALGFYLLYIQYFKPR